MCFAFCCSFLGRGVIDASPLTVWEVVKNPLSRYIYDNMLKVPARICTYTLENFVDRSLALVKIACDTALLHATRKLKMSLEKKVPRNK